MCHECDHCIDGDTGIGKCVNARGCDRSDISMLILELHCSGTADFLDDDMGTADC